MALPSTGPISLSQVNTELGKPSNFVIGMNDYGVRVIANRPTANSSISMSHMRGKSYGVIETWSASVGNNTASPKGAAAVEARIANTGYPAYGSLTMTGPGNTFRGQEFAMIADDNVASPSIYIGLMGWPLGQTFFKQLSFTQANKTLRTDTNCVYTEIGNTWSVWHWENAGVSFAPGTKIDGSIYQY